MKRFVLSSVAVLACVAVMAQAAPKDDVIAAAKKLGDSANYSWKQVTEMGDNSFPMDGKAEKGGLTMVSFSRGDNTTVFLLKGDKGAIKTQDGWKTLEEASQASADGQPNMGRFLVRMAQSFKAPAAQVEQVAADTKELKETEGVIVGDLTEDGAKKLLSFGGRGGANAATVSNGKGTVKFWIKDGALAKYQTHVTGTVSFNNNDRDVDRTTTVEIKDVGTTKIDVPEEAKKKLP